MLPPPSAKQARLIWSALTGLAIAVLVGLVVALAMGLKWVLNVLAPVLWPLAVAGVLAYLLDPVVDYLERKRIKRKRAIIMVFAMALVIMAGIFSSVVPQIIKETTELVNRIPAYAQNIQHRVEVWINNPPEIVKRLLRERASKPAPVVTNAPPVATETNLAPQPAPTNAPAGDSNASLLAGSLDRETLGTATSWIAKVMPRIGSWLFGQMGRVASFFGVLAGLALIPVYAFYLLSEKRGIESKWTDYLPVAKSAFKDELVFVLRSINGYMVAFFRGQVLVAICDGVLYTIGFLAIQLPYAVLLGVIATFLTLIPYLGAIITCTAALIIAAVTFGDWLHPLLVLAVFAVVQTLEGFIISPKIMGDRVGLHPVTIIIAVMAGTTILGGILGGILAIPLTAVLRVVLARYVWKRRLDQQTST
ncbi:MAG TPA: AI-2E family transporter [Clostridia bacterium]|nr:AI-2E family transporter [Clostridia bacterium]